jgi:two-component system, CitB family, sensor kinase
MRVAIRQHILEDNVCQREACRLLEIGAELGLSVEEIGLTPRVVEVFRSADSAPTLATVGDRIVVLSARRDRTDVESLTDNSTACI